MTKTNGNNDLLFISDTIFKKMHINKNIKTNFNAKHAQ